MNHTTLRAEAERWLATDPDPATREAVRAMLTDPAFTGDPAVLDPMDGPLDQATYPSPIDLLVTDDALLLLDLYGAHIRRIPLP